MKAASKFLSAASAAALSAALVVPGAFTVQMMSVSAAEAAVVNRIEVRGNSRIDADTIRNQIAIKPGRTFSGSDVDEAVKTLFATGMFSDVRINQVGSSLVVTVAEHQIVNQVLFQGNKKVKDPQLSAAVQLKPRSPYSQASVDADIEAIKDAYRRVGREEAAVTSQVVDLGQNRVNVIYNVNEGGRTKIAAVNFVGNQAFSNRRLSDVINTKRSNFLSFMLRDDVYSEDKLRADEELLRRSTTIAAMPTSRWCRPSASWMKRRTSTRSPSRSMKVRATRSAMSASTARSRRSIPIRSSRSFRAVRARSTAPRRSRTA
jgi:outer membrane protein insertion porin family